MDPFGMDTATVTDTGARLTVLAAETAAATGAGAVAGPPAATVFGLVGADYLAALASALTQTDAGLARLTAFYGSAAAGTARAVAATAAVEAGATASITAAGLFGGCGSAMPI